jgi:hypothetical protein
MRYLKMKMEHVQQDLRSWEWVIRRTVIPTGARCVSDDPNNNSSTDRTNYARRNNNTNNTNRTDNTQQDRQHPTEVAVVQAALLVQL